MLEIVIPMQTQFNNLIAPTEFTTGFAILIVFIFTAILNAGIRLKSPFILFNWAITMIVFVMTFVAQIAFIWFWIAVLATIVSIVIASMVQNML